jgi:hypothetical protein
MRRPANKDFHPPACALVALLLLTSCESPEMMPKKWQVSFDGKTIGDMVSELGPPQGDASAKQFLLWAEPGKESRLVLRVGCRRTCDKSEQPADVWFQTVRHSDGKVLSTKLVFSRSA